MITKILITILVAVIGITYARYRTAARSSGRRPVRAQPQPWYIRAIPAALVAVVIALGALGYWLSWQEAHTLYTVRVTDTRSGEIRKYPVYKEDVEGRSFTTVDGRVVTLADVERMELVKGAP